MPLGDILRRHAKQAISGTPRTQRDMPSLEDELRDEFGAILDPGRAGREEREAAERAAAREEAKRQAGTGQMVEIALYPGRWEAVELAMGEAETATFVAGRSVVCR